MTTTNFPQGITSFGVPVVGPGGGLPVPTGNIWFVNSGIGINGNPGTADLPWATLAYALANTAVTAGDVIVVADGHAETVTAAAGILAATAGVQIVGLSNGTRRPTITFSTSTAATFKVTAAGVNIQGLRFVTNIASQVTMLDIQAKGVTVQGNYFGEGSATGLSFIDLAGASANASDGLRIVGNEFYAPTAGNYNHAVGLTTVHDNVEVGNNKITGNFALSGIHNVTGKVLTNVWVHDNVVRNLTAAKPALNFISAVTGFASDNHFVGGDTTVNAAKFGTALKVGAGNFANGYSLNAGAEFWYVKSAVVSSTITTAGVDLSVVSIGGELSIEDVIVKTDASTGLAGGTNFQLQTTNANGLAVFFAQAVAGLSGAKTICMANATTANARTVMESGKKLQASSTVANCSGAGTIDIYVKFRRLTAGADVSAA